MFSSSALLSSFPTSSDLFSHGRTERNMLHFRFQSLCSHLTKITFYRKSSGLRSLDPVFAFFRSKKMLSPRSWLWPSSSPAAMLRVRLCGPRNSRCLLSCPFVVLASVSLFKVRAYYRMTEVGKNNSLSLAPYSSVGDFDIPSSREDIDRDSPWNQWLRSEIPQLFLKAMEVCRLE